MRRDRFAMLVRRRALYRATFGTPEGRMVLADLYAFCRVGDPVIVPGDPMLTGFNDGARRVGLRIAKMLDMSDEEILRMANRPEEIDENS